MSNRRDLQPLPAIPELLTPEEEARIELATRCRDCDGIQKVASAGEIVSGPDGVYQLMHNGLKIRTDSHYGAYNREVIKLLRGHHEPQEEYAFDQVVRAIDRRSTILELGSFWSYYSLWFLSVVPQSAAILVEPLEGALEAGRLNFELNARVGIFLRAAISNAVVAEAPVELWPGTTTDVRQTTVDAILDECQVEELGVLHADIQGAEVRMLMGADATLRSRRIRWLFISTHGENIHQRCLQILRRHRYHVACEHTPSESYSVDGLIVASAFPCRRIGISRKSTPSRTRAKLRAMLRVHVLEPLGLKAPTS
jgi:FkbM family methyltransferase